jgi:signal recognition particle subunit SRP19
LERLKDYDHFVLWLDYFNKNLSRRKGRKVGREFAVFDPTIEDLVEAARSVGYDPVKDETNDRARYPRRSFVRSGYIMILRKDGFAKSSALHSIAEKMVQKKDKAKAKR